MQPTAEGQLRMRISQAQIRNDSSFSKKNQTEYSWQAIRLVIWGKDAISYQDHYGQQVHQCGQPPITPSIMRSRLKYVRKMQIQVTSAMAAARAIAMSRF